jgi:hypothetical protein
MNRLRGDIADENKSQTEKKNICGAMQIVVKHLGYWLCNLSKKKRPALKRAGRC